MFRKPLLLAVGLALLMQAGIGLGAPHVSAQTPSVQVTICYVFSDGSRYVGKPATVWGVVNERATPLYTANTNSRGCFVVKVVPNNTYAFTGYYRPNTQTDCAWTQSGQRGWFYIRPGGPWALASVEMTRKMECSA